MSSQGRKPSDLIPSRWLKCPPKSFELLTNKFLIFKTPLSRVYDSQVKDDIFQVQLVFQSMKNRRAKLGLWIDLTNTTRYYDKTEVEQNDCRYVKLQCEGRRGTPSAAQTKSFITLCHNFIRQYPLEIIGVHCTHGFNRSGFLVVSYLVEMLDWELGAAIAEFARIRPPGIYKEDYLIELYKRYDDVEYAPKAPPLPDWCFEEKLNMKRMIEENDDDDFEEGVSDAKRHCGQGSENPKFMEGVSGVEAVSGPLKKEIQDTVRRICEWNRSDFPGSQPVSLDCNNIHLLSKKPYTVSWKADGVRYMLYIKDRNQVYCIDRDNNIFHVKNLTFPHKNDLRSHVTSTLLDGEMVLDKLENGGSRPRYLVYDAVSVCGKSVKDEPFDLRYKLIEKDICAPREKATINGQLNKLKEPFSIRRKEFREVMLAEKFLSESFKKSLSHPPDGLIFQPSKDPYVPGKCPDVLKWKPLSLNSVDFRLKIEYESGEGILRRPIGKLFTGDNTYFGQLKSVKNLKHLDSKIVECTYDGTTDKWVFMRERTDKSFPNSFDTAKSVCNSIKNPISEKYLLDFISGNAFIE
ncbi:UNVERIFIED_CONTAM: hypothetical protein PYX00_006876 [Menopon gallinae]|uniref:mRNA-capping enzyme n=1 Tax=Menopon gallinae TaxID=328185 RepID=A0AAW2HWN4_9NEOP